MTCHETIWGLSGKARSGKDTVYGIIESAVNAGDLPFTSCHRIAFADTIREMLRVGFCLTEKHFEEGKEKPMPEWNGLTPRELMQELGTSFLRRMDEEMLIKRALIRMMDIMKGQSSKDYPLFIITDIRTEGEANEIARLNGGFIMAVTRHVKPTVREHVTEKVLDESLFDCRIENNGTLEDLKKNVLQQVASFLD